MDRLPFIALTKDDLQDLIQRTVTATVAKVSTRTPPIMTKAQVADYLGKSVPTVDRYMREGLPYRKEGKDHPEFYKKQVDRWLDERAQTIPRREDRPEG